MPSVRELVRDWLRERGFDGLVDPDRQCGCDLGGLMECGTYPGDCEPGYKVAGDAEVPWYIAPEKPDTADA